MPVLRKTGICFFDKNILFVILQKKRNYCILKGAVMACVTILRETDIAKSIKMQANQEAPWSLVLFSRLENPVIKEQLLEMLFTANSGRIPKKVLEQKHYAALETIEKDTPVVFTEARSKTHENGALKRERISLGYRDLMSGRKHTWKERHITEAHEKGHVVRWDYSAVKFAWSNEAAQLEPRYCLSGRFSPAFDFSKVCFSEREYENRRSNGGIWSGKTNREIRNALVSYLCGPHELAERMSQLKNYFGFFGDEIFTEEHLSHARSHYVNDTEYDNLMTPFFQAISSEREDAFLSLMNSAGI